jgi:hypothetical protein
MLPVMVAVPVVQPVPDQPENVEPVVGAAVNVTNAPLLKEAEQVLPQLMPAGALVTVPVPVPVLLTAKVKVELMVLHAVSE